MQATGIHIPLMASAYCFNVPHEIHVSHVQPDGSDLIDLLICGEPRFMSLVESPHYVPCGLYVEEGACTWPMDNTWYKVC